MISQNIPVLGIIDWQTGLKDQGSGQLPILENAHLKQFLILPTFMNS